MVYERDEVGMDDGIKMIQCQLARAFAEVYDVRGAWYPINSVLVTAVCSCEKSEDIETARKWLAIETTTINGLEYWRWAGATDPDTVWEFFNRGVRRVP